TTTRTTTTVTATTTPKVATTSAQTQTSLPKPEQRQAVTVTTEAQADPDAEASSATPTAKTAPLAPQAPEAETVAAVSERTSASSSSRPSTVAAVRSGGKGQVVNIADLDLQELENLSLEDLRQLAELLPEGESSRDGPINVKDLLAKLKGAKLDLTRIRAKTQRLTSQKLEGVTEALEGTEEIYSKGRSKIHRKPPPLNVVQAKAYLPKIDELLRKDWKLPVEMDPELRVRVSVVVRRDGMVLQYELIKLSGNEFFDESVRRLFAKTEMLLPLPMDFEAHAAEIDLRFRP
ncbi:MAG: TonB C-terminal domain-containing protein, partial [SAR324 cluster bacterium]|nr:TonB C-terminal domain-containing protein [SAR324 cluster bacterium]